MTTLAADTPRNYQVGDHGHVGIIANDIVYEGAAVGDNASGYGRPLVAADNFLGFAVEKCDNTTSGPLVKAGAAGDLNIHMKVRGIVQLSVSGAAITDLGRPVYASDDATFTFTAGANSFIGYVKQFVSSGVVLVEFDATKMHARQPIDVSFTAAAQSGNGITIAVQLKYPSGQNVAERHGMLFYISDNANGDTQAAPANGTDITIAGGTDGLWVETLSNQAGWGISEADGDIDIALTKVSTGAETVYLVAILPDGRVRASSAITFT